MKEVKWLVWVTTLTGGQMKASPNLPLLVYAPVLATLSIPLGIENPKKPVFRGQFWTAKFSVRTYIYLKPHIIDSWVMWHLIITNCFSEQLLVWWCSLSAFCSAPFQQDPLSLALSLLPSFQCGYLPVVTLSISQLCTLSYVHLCLQLNTRGHVTAKSTCLWTIHSSIVWQVPIVI